MSQENPFRLVAADPRPLLDLIAQVGRATRIFQQESVFCEGLTFNQYHILDLVERSEGELKLARLHGLLEVDKSTTTRLIAPLVREGFLRKGRSRRDSRSINLSLTGPGRETLSRIRA